MAAAHVSGVAAMVLASRVLRPEGSPAATVSWLSGGCGKTARSLGLPPTQQGAGLIDAAQGDRPAACLKPGR